MHDSIKHKIFFLLIISLITHGFILPSKLVEKQQDLKTLNNRKIQKKFTNLFATNENKGPKINEEILKKYEKYAKSNYAQTNEDFDLEKALNSPRYANSYNTKQRSLEETEKKLKLPLPFMNVESIGLIGDWVENNGNFILVPDTDDQPVGIIHFLGGPFVGAAPHLTYRYFLEMLVQQGYVVVASPYGLELDYLKSCEKILSKLDPSLVELEEEYGELPIIGLGHSTGALLQSLISSLFPDVKRDVNVLISINNRKLAKSLPAFHDLIVPLSKRIMKEGEGLGNVREVVKFLRKYVDLAVDIYSESSLSPAFVSNEIVPLFRQGLELLDQIPPMLDGISDDLTDFEPSPQDSKEVLRMMYRAKNTLLVKFESDELDDTDELERVLREADTIMRMRRERQLSEMQVEVMKLEGKHLTPLTQSMMMDLAKITKLPVPKSLKNMRNELSEKQLRVVSKVGLEIASYLNKTMTAQQTEEIVQGEPEKSPQELPYSDLLDLEVGYNSTSFAKTFEILPGDELMKVKLSESETAVNRKYLTPEDAVAASLREKQARSTTFLKTNSASAGMRLEATGTDDLGLDTETVPTFSLQPPIPGINALRGRGNNEKREKKEENKSNRNPRNMLKPIFNRFKKPSSPVATPALNPAFNPSLNYSRQTFNSAFYTSEGNIISRIFLLIAALISGVFRKFKQIIAFVFRPVLPIYQRWSYQLSDGLRENVFVQNVKNSFNGLLKGFKNFARSIQLNTIRIYNNILVSLNQSKTPKTKFITTKKKSKFRPKKGILFKLKKSYKKRLNQISRFFSDFESDGELYNTGMLLIQHLIVVGFLYLFPLY